MSTVFVITRTESDSAKNSVPAGCPMGFFLEDDRLAEVKVLEGSRSLLGNIYVGKVKNVLKNINAAFVEIAGGRNCFLPFSSAQHPVITNRKFDGRILAGDEILVQVAKDAVKTKDPVLTADLSLTGDLCSVSLGEERGIRYSQKLTKERRGALKQALDSLILPEGVTLVVRTKGGEEDGSALIREAEGLLEKSKRLLQIGRTRTVFSLLTESVPDYIRCFSEQNLPFPDRIVTDQLFVYNAFLLWMKENCPEIKTELSLYEDQRLSLFRLYGLSGKLAECTEKNVWLKSGGYLVIEPTEALTVIDVNTGKYAGKKDAESTFLQTNEEAAKEAARQLRLRNLSGIILIDFINMSDRTDEEHILTVLRNACKADTVPVNVVDMTPLGLVEITRKKVERPLAQQLRELGKTEFK